MKPPTYLEAHPRFSTYQAFSVGVGGLGLFRNDEGRPCGIARVWDLTDEWLVLEYAIYARHLHKPRNKALIRHRPAVNPLFPDRRFMLCPKCKRPKISLAFKDDWACKKCLRLHYRCQVVDRDTLDLERKQHLEKEVGKGRPAHMHHRKYTMKHRELLSLRKRFLKIGACRANVEHSRLMTSEWVWTPYHDIEAREHLSVIPLDLGQLDPPPVTSADPAQEMGSLLPVPIDHNLEHLARQGWNDETGWGPPPSVNQ